MRHRLRGRQLSRDSEHRKALRRNLAQSLFEHGKITTTEAKAKRLRPLAEKLITFAKKGDLPARRQVMAAISNKSVVHTLFAVIGPRFAARNGGCRLLAGVDLNSGVQIAGCGLDQNTLEIEDTVAQFTLEVERSDP